MVNIAATGDLNMRLAQTGQKQAMVEIEIISYMTVKTVSLTVVCKNIEDILRGG